MHPQEAMEQTTRRTLSWEIKELEVRAGINT